LASPGNILSIWTLLLAITVLHYLSSPHQHWIHDLLRRAYYLPIVIAGMRSGLLGGLAISGVVTLAYIPHAFFDVERFDPAHGLEKSLEIILYFVVACVSGYLSDLEHRRRMQLQAAMDEQKSLTKQLVRAGRLAALGEVVAGIAHEIKNPLHSLAGTAEIVDPVISSESEVRRMWEIHKSEIERLKRTADRFLTFARPEPVKAVALDLREVASRLVDLVGAEARQKHIDIEERLPDQSVIVHGDVDQLAQVGLNVAINAIKAIGDSGGKICISVGTEHNRQARMTFLRIENDGPPIAKEEREHLFDPFHSGNNGTGLGLSISARIAEQHGGFMEVENEGLGVCFTLFLPGRKIE
jgi:signal transduction histidine kinase